MKRKGFKSLLFGALYLCVLSALFSIFMLVGRTVAGVHWLTDIMGSILLSTGLFLLYRAVVLIIDDKAKA